MTTQVRSQSRGLRMSLLALTASASVVGGMFVSVAPAYSADGVGDQPGQCVTASEEGASIIASSVVATGVPLHLEGSGWGPSSEEALGFVIVTLDDGQEKRSDDMVLPTWVPSSVARNRSAWAVAKVGADGTFTADIDLPATWTAGTKHQVMIGDGVTGNYVQVEVTVVESAVEARSCSLAPTEPSVTDGTDPVTDDSAAPTHDPGSENTSGNPTGAPSVPSESSTSASGQNRTSERTQADDATSSASTPSPSSSSASGGSSTQSSTSSGGSGNSADPTPEPSTSSTQQSVSASQIGPKAHSEQQASNQAAREEESRLNGWILAGGGALALLGAIVTVSIVRRSHGLAR